MKKRKLVLLGAALLTLNCFPFTAQAEQIKVVDDLNNEIVLEHPAESVVSLSPASTEILFAIDAGNLVVGRTDYCNYPADVSSVDSIGSYSEPNMELILEKNPELVIASDYVDDAIRSQLEDAGIAVCVISANELSKIENNIELVGQLTGHEDKSKDVVADMEKEKESLAEVMEKVSDHKSAFVDLGSFYSAGSGSLLDEAMNMLALENICADQNTMWPMLSVEKIIEKNPDLYISLFSKYEDILQNAGLGDLDCMNRDGGFIYVDPKSEMADMLQRPGPRFVQGVMELGKEIYPDLFAN